MSDLPDNAVPPKGCAAWRAWLAAHHDRDEGVWFVRYKKAARTMTPARQAKIDDDKAERAATRARRIDETVRLAQQNEQANQWGKA